MFILGGRQSNRAIEAGPQCIRGIAVLGDLDVAAKLEAHNCVIRSANACHNTSRAYGCRRPHASMGTDSNNVEGAF